MTSYIVSNTDLVDETFVFVRELMEGVDAPGHNLDHFSAVLEHAKLAIKCEPELSINERIQVLLAAYLHDVDDKKLFPNSRDYENARRILIKVVPSDPDHLIEGIIQMIDLVSCSKNGDRDPPGRWMAIPRDCDRLEALGQIGINRCREYTLHRGMPLHTEQTPISLTLHDVWKNATVQRFSNYMKGIASISMIDHYYDKLLHIGHPYRLKSQNSYIIKVAEERNELMAQFVVDYWQKTTDK